MLSRPYATFVKITSLGTKPNLYSYPMANYTELVTPQGIKEGERACWQEHVTLVTCREITQPSANTPF